MREQSPNAPKTKVGAAIGIDEPGIPRGIFRLQKFREGEIDPYEVIEFENAYVNVGGQSILDFLIGAGPTAFNNANAFLGVGDSSTATSASMTDLQASTNKTYKAMASTFPSRSGQTTTWQSSFGSSDANYQWNEVALFNGSNPPTAKMLSRGVQTLGTKASGTTWTLSYTITIP